MKDISIVIPIHNEEVILRDAVTSLTERLAPLGFRYEILLSENGSRDRTFELANELAQEFPSVRVLKSPKPNYGYALRMGIEQAQGNIVICDEIDLGDVGFYVSAKELLDRGADMVVGSKRHKDSKDERPWIRRQGTTVINTLLRVTLDFKGTDTHGLKAFRRDRVLPVVGHCTVEHDLFASELVIRAGREGLDVREIPLTLREIRPPSIHLTKRVPRVLKNLAKLVWVIRVRG